MKKTLIFLPLLLICLNCTSCKKDSEQKTRSVLYYAKVYSGETYSKLSGDTYIRLFDDGLLEVHSIKAEPFAEGKESYEIYHSQKLANQKFQQMKDIIDSFEDCKEETSAQDGATHGEVISVANGKSYTFYLGSDVNIWHSYVVSELLEIAYR